MASQKWLLALMVFNTLLALFVAVRYSYNTQTTIESLGAFVILLGVTVLVGLSLAAGAPSLLHRLTPLAAATGFGLLVGLLWAVEIGINNFLAPPLPGRDIIDNLFWGVIALLLLAGSSVAALRAGRFGAGVAFGVWSGLASGAVACGMALAMIVFGMHFLLHDPLNIAEWAARPASEAAPSMAAYFAFQTLAGGIMHLVVLGAGMGLLLGALGGGVGKILRLLRLFDAH